MKRFLRVMAIHTVMAKYTSLRLIVARVIYGHVMDSVGGMDDTTEIRFGEVCARAMSHDGSRWIRIVEKLSTSYEDYGHAIAEMADSAIIWPEEFNKLLRILASKVGYPGFEIDIHGRKQPELFFGVNKNLLKINWVKDV